MSTATAENVQAASSLPEWIETAATAAGGPEWLMTRRRDGLSRFAAVGFPGRRDEHWKYTDLKLVQRRSFAPAQEASEKALEIPGIDGLDCPTLVFVNGRLRETHALPPSLAVLDETDSGLDIDALKVVANGVNSLRSPERSMVVVTHYQRLLEHIVPDFVHVLSNGRIVRSGGRELALELEERGYDWLREGADAA